MGNNDFREKLVVIGLFVGIFLPVRMLFVEYVSDHWLGSLGLISGLGFLFLILVKKQKLGKIGKIFEKNTQKMVFGKTAKLVIGLSLISLLYFGSSVMFIERGDSLYSEDKTLFHDAIIKDNNLDSVTPNNLQNIQVVYDSQNRLVSTFDYAFSITYAIMNDVSGGWLEHLYFVLFVKQIEILGFFVFYRLIHKKSTVKMSRFQILQTPN